MSQGGSAPVRPPLWIACVWVVVALLSSVCGIGGGLFGVPLLHYGAKLPLRTSVGTALCLVFTLALTATVTEALRPQPQLLLDVAGLLVLGALPGSQLGFFVSKRIDPLWLKALFVSVLLLAGLRVLSAGDHGGQVAGGLSGGDYVLVPAVGAVAGFLSPLLGIGGGLVVIPALFLGIPTIGYIEARASSLAMAVVTSGWSVRNYVKSGEVQLRAVAPLIAATVIGAALGVRMVHLAGWAELARNMLGGVLLLVAARFAADVWRTRAGRAARSGQA